MAKVKKHQVVFRDRFIFDSKNYEREETYNIKGGLFPSRKVIATTFQWVLDNLGDFSHGVHGHDRMNEKKTGNRTLKEILRDGEAVELRFGKFSNALRAAIVRVHGLSWDDVYVLSFEENFPKDGKINVSLITTWKNRRGDIHSTLKKVFSNTPCWKTIKEQF